MNNRINNHPYYSFSQNQYPNCFYPQPNPILRFQYHNSQLSYALNRNPNFPHPMMPVQNFNISRRPSIKTAESNAIIIIDEEIPEIKNIQPISSDLTTNIAIIEKKENSNNKNLKISKSYYEYLQKKVCEKCRISERDDQLLLCDYCDDAYHSYCLQTVLVDVEEMADRKDLSWACPICEKELVDINIQEKRKQEIELENLRAKNNCFLVLDKRNFMNEMIMNNNLGRNFQMRTPMFQSMQTMNIETCTACKLSFSGEKQEACFICHRKFHCNCLNQRNPKKIICYGCEEQINNSIPPNFYEIFEKKPAEKVELKSIKPRKKKKISFSKSNLNLFKLPCLSTPLKVFTQKKNLYFYLKARGSEFSDDLVYDQEKCPRSQNFSNLEPDLRELKKANIEIIKQFKQMTLHGNYPPVMIEEDKNQGFVVKAYEDIAKRTLICEYAGEVDIARNKVFDKSNDSIMMLLRTTRSKTSLVICPNKFANIAKFISGINNFDPVAKNKQNVNSVRFSIENQARVFLYARRNIKVGEILYYDYNAGGLNEYPTLGFV